MPAWYVTKLWDATEVANYRTYAAKEGPNKAAKAVKCTCEDLAIRIVTEYASGNGLPAYFYNDSHPMPTGLTPEHSANLSEYLEKVLSTTGARDLSNYSTVDFVPGASKSDPNSLRLAEEGDLILLYNPVHHVQVVISASTSEVKIAQGNTHDPSGWNSSNPTSSGYVGVAVAVKSHVLDAKSGKWLYGGSEVFKNDHGRLMMWDTDNWNSRMTSYTVKKGDNAHTIATAVYGSDAWRHWAYIIGLLQALGTSHTSPKEGTPLLLWR
jgi:nucleoid-associated protein YgaU